MHAKKQRMCEEQKPFNLLPVVLRQVFLGFLESEDVRMWREVARNVSKDRAELETVFMIDNNLPDSYLCIPAKVRRVVVRGAETPNLVRCASEYPFLHEVKFPKGSSCASLENITTCQNLQTLDLTMFGVVTNRALAVLYTLPHLKKLDMSWVRIENIAAFMHIARITSLEKLEVRGTGISKDVLALVSNLPNLTMLNLTKCSHIKDVDLDFLANTKLRTLHLSGNRQITDEGVAHVARIATLEKLSLGKTNITDRAMVDVAKLVKLRVLDLLDCDQITSGGFAQLSTLTNLVRLFGNLMPMTDEALRHLACLSKLEKLNLSFCANVTDTGVSYIAAGMKSMTDLNLTGCDITDAAVLQLHLLPRLRTLRLRNCTEITDFSVASLVAIRTLKMLNVIGCPKVTRNALVRFPTNVKLYSK